MNNFKNIIIEGLSCYVAGRDEKIPLKVKTIIYRLIIIFGVYASVGFSLAMLLQHISSKTISKEEQYKAKIIELEKIIKQYQIN